jgi:regulator of replication initiation timing
VEIMAALSALTSTMNLGKTALALRDQKMIDEALTEMNQKLMEVTQSALALLAERHAAIEESNALREKHRKLEETLTDLSGYETYLTRRGAVCLRPKPGTPEANMAIHVCANCAARGKKTYLQPESSGLYLTCPSHGRIGSDKWGVT